MIVGSDQFKARNGGERPLESFGCLWIQASLHENAKILKHRTLALSEELRSQGADMGGQHPIGTLRRMCCTPHHLVSHGVLSWLALSFDEVRRCGGSASWFRVDRRVTNEYKCPKMKDSPNPPKLAKCDIPKQEISRSSFDSLHWSICHARSTAPNPSGRGTSLQYHILIWGTYHYHMEGYFWGMFCFFLFSSLALWLLWVCGLCGFTMLYLSTYLSIYLYLYLSNLT